MHNHFILQQYSQVMWGRWRLREIKEFTKLVVAPLVSYPGFFFDCSYLNNDKGSSHSNASEARGKTFLEGYGSAFLFKADCTLLWVSFLFCLYSSCYPHIDFQSNKLPPKNWVVEAEEWNDGIDKNVLV